ncbi:MAG: FAD-binding oxidoreductase [Chlorobi bacterium]|nr:FAD-binding oxidoreductase [Chlorobiota bacterium]
MSRSADVVIIGFGIAGATLARRLLEQGVSIAVFESPQRTAVTRGAGAISTMAGLRFGVIEQWQQWWSAAWNFYGAYDAIEPVACYRLLYRDDELRFWQRKRRLAIESDQAHEATLPDSIASYLQPPQATVEIRRAARVCAARVLDAIADQLRSAMNATYLQRTIGECDIVPFCGGYEVGGISCRHVVFCDGAWLASNRWFDWVPRMFARGQRIRGIFPTRITTEPIWLSVAGKSLIIEGNQFTFGSTYDWSLLEPVVTEDTTAHLCRQLSAFLHCEFQVSSAWAGVRPITADLRPIIGEHPVQKGMWVFNGLGSRGLLLAPRLADLLTTCIVRGCNCLDKWDVARFTDQARFTR